VENEVLCEKMEGWNGGVVRGWNNGKEKAF
jgi:hypothetical protein